MSSSNDRIVKLYIPAVTLVLRDAGILWRSKCVVRSHRCKVIHL